ncbi:hypothetical protein WICMUC_004090 [Wickerhamomyces mucosus]|uniref:Altered inheritance of mitochondria protein 18, mitochondrial n=1 Tax=Wickerhamomyces mucosus TaxID=1378264 RepID=A0A9P8PID0_9ASCO|nr:hypothetical protein WICMUC_004090 [Wickerhamomyces mucosus]
MIFMNKIFTPQAFKSIKLIAGVTIASTSSVFLYNNVLNHHHHTIQLDDKVKDFDPTAISVDKSVGPLPLNLKLSTSYQLLGYGTRSVTFLKFRVYALGIYIADDDVEKIPLVFDSNYLSNTFIDDHDQGKNKSHSENVSDALKTPIKSKILISNFLDSNVRLVARITPVRNTDFGHLKDGLIKSILASGIPNDENLDNGLNELRNAFQRKGSVPKNHNLILERLTNGELQIYYEDLIHDRIKIGKVNNPIISKLLFLQYLQGGLSPDTKDCCIKRISELVVI